MIRGENQQKRERRLRLPVNMRIIPNHGSSASAERAEHGATLVEVALTCGLFLFILLVFFDFLLYIFQINVIQFAADGVLRRVIVDGSADAAAIDTQIRAEARMFQLELLNAPPENDIRVCSENLLATIPTFNPDCTAESRGMPGKSFTVRVRYSRPSMIRHLLGPLAPFDWKFQTTLTSRNENYF